MDWILQILAMLTDLLLVVAILIIAHYGNWLTSIILLIGVHYSQRKVGGWFFAWKTKNIRAFFKNWKKINGVVVE